MEEKSSVAVITSMVGGISKIEIFADSCCPLTEISDSIIRAFMQATQNNYTKTAKLLGITRQTIYNRLGSSKESDI